MLALFFFSATDESELYVFGEDGRHIATRDATTLRNVLTFQYDASGALASVTLASVTDAGGLVTKVQGSSNGSAIVSSHGVRTTIDVDANGVRAAAHRAFGLRHHGPTRLAGNTHRVARSARPAAPARLAFLILHGTLP